MGELVNNFADDPKNIRSAFSLIETEGKKRFLDGGEMFKAKLMETGSTIEPFVTDILKDIKIEKQPIPNFSELFSLNLPNFQTESLIFNTNINASCLQSFCQNDQAIVDNQLQNRRSKGNLQIGIDIPTSVRMPTLGNTPSNYMPGVPSDLFGFVSTPKSANGRKFSSLSGSASTHSLHAQVTKNSSFNQYHYNNEQKNSFVEMTPTGKNFGKKSQGQLFTCNTPSSKYITNANYNDQIYADYNSANINNKEELLSVNMPSTRNKNGARSSFTNAYPRNEIASFGHDMIDSRAFQKDDNLLMEMSLQDIPELGHPNPGLKQTRTFHFDGPQNSSARVTQNNFAKSSDGTPRDFNSHLFSKTTGQAMNFGTVSSKIISTIKPQENADKFEKSSRSSFRSINTPSNMSASKKAEKKSVQTPSQMGKPSKMKESIETRSKERRAPGDISRDRSIDRKAMEIERTKALKQLQTGRIGEILKDLKSNKLMTLDMSNSGKINRFKRHSPERDLRPLAGGHESQDSQAVAQPYY